jgi:hypothetical protein
MNKKAVGNIWLEITAALFFIGIMALLPLYFPRTGFAFITRQKTDLFMTYTVIASVATAVILFLTTSRFRVKDYFIKDEPRRPVALHEWALLAFLLLALLSSIFSPWQDFVWRGFTHDGVSGRWEGFWAFFCYGLAFIITARFYKPRTLLNALCAAGVILLCLYGILQYLGFDILARAGYLVFDMTGDSRVAPLSGIFRTTLGNINIVSAYCSLVAVLFAALFAAGEGKEKSSKWEYLHLAASVFAFAMMRITRGDAATVGVIGAMVLLLPYWISDRRRLGKMLVVMSLWSAVHVVNQLYLTRMSRPENIINFCPADQWFLTNFTPFFTGVFAVLAAVLLGLGLCLLLLVKKWPKKPMKIAGVAFLAISIGSGLGIVYGMSEERAGTLGDVVWEAREVLHGRIDDNFGSYRGWVWRNSVEILPENPWLGTGPGTFFFALGGVQIAPRSEAAHNNPVPLTASAGRVLQGINETGLSFDKAHNTFLQIAVTMGIPALIAYLVFLGAIFIPSIKTAFDRPLLLAFGAGALSYIIQTFFQVDTPIDRPLLYVALGVMAGELWRNKIEKKAVRP